MILTVTMNPAIDKTYVVDHFQPNQVFRTDKIIATAGGKGINVARVVSILGEAVAATGFLGGNNGAFIADELIKQNVRNEFLKTQGETRVCLNIIDEINSTSTEILESGPTLSHQEVDDFLHWFDQLLDQATIITVSGSLPKGLESDFYRLLIRSTRQKTKRLLLDTSGVYLKEAIKEKPFMITPNETEVRTLIEQESFADNDYPQILMSLKEQGIYLPILTLGSAGCMAMLEDGVYKFSCSRLNVINPVGSGDAFLAGCAVGLKQERKLIDVIKLGMAAGMSNTQFLATGMVCQEMVEKFFQVIRVERLV